MRLRPVAEIRDPVHGYVRLTEVEKDLVDSPYVQRLRRIHQLAGSYLVYPGAVHTRFEHVVGAMHVAGQIADQLSKMSTMDEHQAQEVRIAALLHDVGHGPFSHMFEEVLAGKTEVSHEDISQKIILETSISDILQKYGFSAKRMSALAVGKLGSSPPFMNEIIAGGLSADMMDYLPRDSYFTGVEYGKVDVQRVIDSLHVSEGHLVLDDAALYAFEALLLARYEMFKAVYFHRTVRAAELMLVHSMKLADEALRLSELTDLAGYLELTDEVVLHKLATIEGRTRSLTKARQLALDFRERRLVKCVFERVMQRRDPEVGKLFADEEARRVAISDIAERAKVEPVHVYIDVPTTPSVPRTYSNESLTEVRLIRGHGRRRGVKTVPIGELPLVGSIAGYMDVLRVYTNQSHRIAVEKAAARLFKEEQIGS